MPTWVEKKRLVIVEDDNEVKKVFQKMFKAYGDLDIRTSENATEALDLLSSFRPHFVMLDIMLPYGPSNETSAVLRHNSDPEMSFTNGFQILEAVRKGKVPHVEPDTPIAVVTALAEILFLDRIRRLLGSNGWLLEKPTDDFVLEILICEQLQVKCRNIPGDELEFYRVEAEKARAKG